MKTKKTKAKNKGMSSGLRKPAKRYIDMKGKWKTIELDPSVFSEEGLEGLVCFEELTDYRLLDNKKAAAIAANEPKGEKKKKAKKRKADEGEEAGEKEDPEIQEGESAAEPTNKKKKNRKNKKRVAKESDISAQAVEQKDNAVPEPGEDEAADEDPGKDSAAISADSKDAKRSKKKKKKERPRQQTVKDLVQKELQKPESSSELEKEKPSQGKVTKAPPEKPKNWTNAALSGSDDKNVDMGAWKDLFVPSPVLKALRSLGFASPTPIQALALPPAIRDRLDILGAAETGQINVIMASSPHVVPKC